MSRTKTFTMNLLQDLIGAALDSSPIEVHSSRIWTLYCNVKAYEDLISEYNLNTNTSQVTLEGIVFTLQKTYASLPIISMMGIKDDKGNVLAQWTLIKA